jgi:hypothetical protein
MKKITQLAFYLAVLAGASFIVQLSRKKLMTTVVLRELLRP